MGINILMELMRKQDAEKQGLYARLVGKSVDDAIQMLDGRFEVNIIEPNGWFDFSYVFDRMNLHVDNTGIVIKAQIG